jgi:hypothetical protein
VFLVGLTEQHCFLLLCGSPSRWTAASPPSLEKSKKGMWHSHFIGASVHHTQHIISQAMLSCAHSPLSAQGKMSIWNMVVQGEMQTDKWLMCLANYLFLLVSPSLSPVSENFDFLMFCLQSRLQTWFPSNYKHKHVWSFFRNYFCLLPSKPISFELLLPSSSSSILTVLSSLLQISKSTAISKSWFSALEATNFPDMSYVPFIVTWQVKCFSYFTSLSHFPFLLLSLSLSLSTLFKVLFCCLICIHWEYEEVSLW